MVADVNKLIFLILNVEQPAAPLAELLNAAGVTHRYAGDAAIAGRELGVVEKRIVVGGESIKSGHSEQM